MKTDLSVERLARMTGDQLAALAAKANPPVRPGGAAWWEVEAGRENPPPAAGRPLGRIDVATVGHATALWPYGNAAREYLRDLLPHARVVAQPGGDTAFVLDARGDDVPAILAGIASDRYHLVRATRRGVPDAVGRPRPGTRMEQNPRRATRREYHEMPGEDREYLDQIVAAYSPEGGALQWYATRWVPGPLWAEMMKRALENQGDSYNEFNHRVALRLAGDFPHPDFEFLAAREYSVAVYIRRADGHPVTEVPVGLGDRWAKKMARRYAADEVASTARLGERYQKIADSYTALRIWWD